MAASIGAPRVLLRRLREIMAGPESGQAKLDKTVVQVAANMVAEVCSIYVRRRDGSMELFATEGLNKDAVHKTHLKPGEGLVGQIARQAEPMNLTEAHTHPAFSYRPETGEEIYHSFLGVPILRQGKALGVLTVQNRTHRQYSDEEVEAMQTIAMALAELVTSPEFVGNDTTDGTRRLGGTALSGGIALGHIVHHEPRVAVTRLIADDLEHERARLETALRELRSTIDDMMDRGDVPLAGEHRDILEAYRMFAHDRGWNRRLDEAVKAGLTAEAAVERVLYDMRPRMLKRADPFLRERLHDLDDLSNRLLRVLAGRTTAAAEDLPADAILVARTMGPAELLDYERGSLRGLVLEEGGLASHVAIVARALGIPAVGQATGIVQQAETGDEAVLDADTGEVYIRPTADIVAAYTDKIRFQAKRQERYAKLRGEPAVTKDGAPVALQMNAGLLVDLPYLEQSGAAGIGLFRTELQFMISATLPRLERQMEIYRTVMDAAGGKPVVFRSLDIGGDKMLPYMRQTQEANPALGWRAVRMALDRPGLFRTQIRALLRAAAGRELRVMIPMVSEAEEFEAAKELVEKEKALGLKHGHAMPSKVLLGAMIEVPALLWQLDRLLPLVDFASVGSNDLLQFLFAADRGNLRVADRFDPLSLPVLRALKRVTREAERAGTSLSLCGEMAGRPLEAMALLGLGFRTISMAPASVGPVKAMVRSLDLKALTARMDALLGSAGADSRKSLAVFAEETGVEL